MLDDPLFRNLKNVSGKRQKWPQNHVYPRSDLPLALLFPCKTESFCVSIKAQNYFVYYLLYYFYIHLCTVFFQENVNANVKFAVCLNLS